MGEEAERSKDGRAVRMTESETVPPLVVRQGTNLVFSADGEAVEVKLSELMRQGDRAVVGLLLWGILLTLHDLELDFRKAIEKGEQRADEAMNLAKDPAALLGHLTGTPEKMGVSLPLGGLADILATPALKRTPEGPTSNASGERA